MDNRFIELREAESQIKIDNGFYESTLQEKTVINQGDSIVINKVVIDTDSISQQSINIKEPITLQISNMLYLQKVFNNPNEAAPPGFTTGFDAYPQSGQNFVLCNEIDSAVSTNVKTIVNLFVSRSNYNRTKDFGGLSVIIQYLNEFGDQDQMVVNVPKFSSRFGVQNPVQINLVFTNTQEPKVITTQKDLGKYDIIVDLGPTTDLESYTWNPYIFSDTYELKEGQYTPLELCNTINRQIQKNQYGNNPTDSNFMQSQFLRQLQTLGASLSFVQCQSDDSGFWPGPEVVPQLFNHLTAAAPNGSNIWVGASQMELSYNNETSKFFWNYTHMPIFDNKGAEIVMYNGNTSYPADHKQWINNKLGGVLFHGLTATDADDNFYNFWENDLGFDLSSLLTSFTTINITGTNDTGNAPVMKAVDGENTTGAFINLGSAIASAGAYNIVPAPDGAADPVINPQEATSENTIPINAPISIINKLYQYPYFCVELQCGYNNKVISVDGNHANIVAIISKYYTLNSFTYGSSADSITYTHIGPDSLYIDSFRIRILNPDKVLAQGIGDQNSVILQIVKGSN